LVLIGCFWPSNGLSIPSPVLVGPSSDFNLETRSS
jgi:hypothetical protein